MHLAHARTAHSLRALPGSPRNSVPQTPFHAAEKDGAPPAQTALFQCRSPPATDKLNPSPPPSESAGSLPGSKRLLPRCAEIHIASRTPRAEVYFPAAIPVVAPPAAPAASSGPGPPVFAGSRTPPLSSLPRLLPLNQMP